MANRRLKLQKFELENVNFQWLGAYRLRIEVTDPNESGADPYIFLFLRRPANPYNGDTFDDFHGAASPVDMEYYPVGEPNGLTSDPFYRLDVLELDFRSLSEFQETWTLIVADASNLLLALNRMEELTPTEEVYVGADDETGGSSSSSSA